MLQFFYLFLLCLVLQSNAAAQNLTVEEATKVWQGLLKKHVDLSGGVDYQGLAQDRQLLQTFLAAHAHFSPATWNDEQKKAVYLNLYNAAMLAYILRYTQEKGLNLASQAFLDLEVNKITVNGGNIWDGKYRINLGGVELNQDTIEHQLLLGAKTRQLAAWQVSSLDPRLHAALNCASVSCPRLRELAYQAATLEGQLTENMQGFLAAPLHFRKLSPGSMQANSLVYWYYNDFDAYAQNILKLPGAGTYLATFVDSSNRDGAWTKAHLQDSFDDRNKLALRFSSAYTFTYNWRINDRRNMRYFQSKAQPKAQPKALPKAQSKAQSKADTKFSDSSL